MSNTVYLGAEEADEKLEVTVVRGKSTVDFTQVTTAFLRVKGPTGQTADWPVVMSEQIATSMKLTHLFVLADLAAGAGRYGVVAWLTLTGSPKPRRCLPRPLIAQDIYG